MLDIYIQSNDIFKIHKYCKKTRKWFTHQLEKSQSTDIGCNSTPERRNLKEIIIEASYKASDEIKKQLTLEKDVDTSSKMTKLSFPALFSEESTSTRTRGASCWRVFPHIEYLRSHKKQAITAHCRI